LEEKKGFICNFGNPSRFKMRMEIDFRWGKFKFVVLSAGVWKLAHMGHIEKKAPSLRYFNVRILNARTKKASKHLNSLY